MVFFSGQFSLTIVCKEGGWLLETVEAMAAKAMLELHPQPQKTTTRTEALTSEAGAVPSPLAHAYVTCNLKSRPIWLLTLWKAAPDMHKTQGGGEGGNSNGNLGLAASTPAVIKIDLGRLGSARWPIEVAVGIKSLCHTLLFWQSSFGGQWKKDGQHCNNISTRNYSSIRIITKTEPHFLWPINKRTVALSPSLTVKKQTNLSQCQKEDRCYYCAVFNPVTSRPRRYSFSHNVVHVGIYLFFKGNPEALKVNFQGKIELGAWSKSVPYFFGQQLSTHLVVGGGESNRKVYLIQYRCWILN